MRSFNSPSYNATCKVTCRHDGHHNSACLAGHAKITTVCLSFVGAACQYRLAPIGSDKESLLTWQKEKRHKVPHHGDHGSDHPQEIVGILEYVKVEYFAQLGSRMHPFFAIFIAFNFPLVARAFFFHEYTGDDV